MSENHLLFEKFVSLYEQSFSIIFKKNHPAIIHFMNQQKHQKILEIGVGTGDFLHHYPQDSSVFGIDISQKMIEFAKAKESNVNLQVMNALDMSFADNSFDLVICKSVFSVVKEPFKLISEIKRVLKPNGKIILVTKFQRDNILSKSFFLFANIISKIFFGYTIDYSLNEFIEKSELKLLARQDIYFGIFPFQDALYLSKIN